MRGLRSAHGDGVLGELHVEDAAEVLADDLGCVVLVVFVLFLIIGVVATTGDDALPADQFLAAPCLVLLGEGGVGLDLADGGEEAAVGVGPPAASISAGGFERHGECHGVVQVTHRSSSTSGIAAAWHTMHTPSPSHDRPGISLLLLVGGGGGRASSPCARARVSGPVSSDQKAN
ncbi:hypothetical protein ZWY2020_056885 [Hordeum vulgare]|nr:hypothetical protein ZWY2020_056885 [Hordeum vulgare]